MTSERTDALAERVVAEQLVEQFDRMVRRDGGSLTIASLEEGTLRVLHHAGSDPACEGDVCVLPSVEIEQMMTEVLERRGSHLRIEVTSAPAKRPEGTHRMSDTKLTVVNPVATPAARSDTAERSPRAPRRKKTLEGSRIALYWNGKQNGLDALDRTRRSSSSSAIRDVTLRRADRRARRHQPLPVAGAARPCSSARSTSRCARRADCGSCTLVADARPVRARTPRASRRSATPRRSSTRTHASASKTFGVPEACPLIVPECFSNKTPEQIARDGRRLDATSSSTMLTTDGRAIFDELPQFSRWCSRARPSSSSTARDLLDAFDEMQRRVRAQRLERRPAAGAADAREGRAR